MASLGAEEAEKVRRSHLADTIPDYPKFNSGVETLFEKFEFEVSFRVQLRNHSQSGAESIAAYAALTTEVCSKAYSAFATETQLSLAVDHFIAGLAVETTRDYLLHDRALRTLTLQHCVQIAQACEASRLSLHEPATAAGTASIKLGAPAITKCTCAPVESAAAFACQPISARDGRVKGNAHSSRKDDQRTRTSAPRTSHPQQKSLSSASREPPPPYANPDNANHALVDQQKNFGKPRAITCFKCGKRGHVASSCISDARSARKCYACGGIGHMARDCTTRAAQAKAESSSSTLKAVASAGKGAA